MPRLIYTHRKGELGKLKRVDAAKPAAPSPARLDASARETQAAETQAAARQTMSEGTKLRKPNQP